MGRTLVIGDIHGGLLALQQVMERAGIQKEDHLIFLGDYVDGWSDSAKTISFLMALSRKQKTTFIRGNHDDLVYQWLKGKTMSPKWMMHGGQSTIDAYMQISQEEKLAHIAFYESMKDYYVSTNNKMFCHAGFQNLNGPQHEWHSTAFYWDRTLWEMVCVMDMSIHPGDVRYPKRLQLFDEIYIGHTPVTRIGASVPTRRANVWNIDTGAAFHGSISILDTTSKSFWQSDAVSSLYPEEIGRNSQSYTTLSKQ